MPENYTAKRRDIAQRMINHTTSLVDALRALGNLMPDVRESGGGFQDDDFEGVPELAHLNAWTANTLLQTVIPSLAEAAELPIQEGSELRRAQVLLAVKRAS